MNRIPHEVLGNIFEWLPSEGTAYRYYNPRVPVDQERTLQVSYFSVENHLLPDPTVARVSRRWKEAHDELYKNIFDFLEEQKSPLLDHVTTVVKIQSGKEQGQWEGAEKARCIALLFRRVITSARAVGPDLASDIPHSSFFLNTIRSCLRYPSPGWRERLAALSFENEWSPTISQKLLEELKSLQNLSLRPKCPNLLEEYNAGRFNNALNQSLVDLLDCSDQADSMKGKTAAEIRRAPDIFRQITTFNGLKLNDQNFLKLNNPDLLPLEIQLCCNLKKVCTRGIFPSSQRSSFDDVVKWLERFHLQELSVPFDEHVAPGQWETLRKLVQARGTQLEMFGDRINHFLSPGIDRVKHTVKMLGVATFDGIVQQLEIFPLHKLIASSEDRLTNQQIEQLQRIARKHCTSIEITEIDNYGQQPLHVFTPRPINICGLWPIHVFDSGGGYTRCGGADTVTNVLYRHIIPALGSLLRGTYRFAKDWILRPLIYATLRIARAILRLGRGA